MADTTTELTDSALSSRQCPVTTPGPWTRAAPWLAGAGIAVGHIAVSSNCTLPQQGRCGACGSCIVAVGSLVGWALLKKRRGGEFYSDDQASFS